MEYVSRDSRRCDGADPGPTFVLFGRPHRPSGNVIDQLEGRVRAAQEDEIPLPPTALLDAFEVLDSAWRNFFGRRLIERPRLGGVADLSQPAGSHAEFSSRMTQLDDLVKGLRVDDDLLTGTTALAPSATIGRMHDALGKVLSGADLTSAKGALGILSAANGIRVALQHKIDPTRRADLRLPSPVSESPTRRTGLALGRSCGIEWWMQLGRSGVPCWPTCPLPDVEARCPSRAIGGGSSP